MTLLSRISGLIRDIALAYLFGASVVADLFFIAFRVPNVFRRLFAEGAFSQAFVPVLMDYRHRGPVELKLFLAHLSTKFVGILSVVVVLGVVFSAALAGLFAPGLLDSPNEFALVTELLRITFPYLGFISLTAYAGALFNAHGYFALPAITPVMLNLCLIVAAGIALAGVFEAQPVIIVAWGVMAAGIVQMTMQLPLLAKLDLMPAPRIGHHEGLAQVRSLLIPALLANSVGQINTLINTILASTLIAGSISWLYYADRLLELPIGLVAVALGTVLLPHLSAMVVQGNPQRFQRTLNWGITLGVGLGLPAAVALYLLAEPLLAVIYLSLPGSAMTVADIQMAGAALQLFAIALPGFVLVKIFSPAFFANKDSKTPLRCAVLSLVANLLVGLSTYQWLGHVGLALATAVSAWVQAFALYAYLVTRKLAGFDKDLGVNLLRVISASLVMAILITVFSADSSAWLAMATPLRMAMVAAICMGGLLVYLGTLLLLGLRPSFLQLSNRD